MADLSHINVEEIQEQEFTPVEPGWYQAHVEFSDYKENKNKTGWLLSLRFKITDEQAPGRVVFANLNLEHENTQAQQISQRQFKKLCTAVGKNQVNDSSELHELPVLIKIKIRPESAQYPASNDVVDYKSIDEGGEARPW